MAPRPNWKGYLKLSLVSCPVALYTAATESGRVSLRTLNRETGNRLRRQMVDSETGDVVETEEQVRGYEISRNEYVVLDDEELDAVALESTHTIDIESFVPRKQVDELYLDTPYYLIPDDKVGEEAFIVIREAMRQREVVGLARVVLYRRERILMLAPRGAGILATALRYAPEVKQESDYFDEVPQMKLPKEMLDLASHIIDTKSGTFDPSRFQDRYEQALVDLIRSKQAGQPVHKAEPPRQRSNVVDLMEALRRSVSTAGSKPPAPSARAPKRTEKRAPARRKPAAARSASARRRKAG